MQIKLANSIKPRKIAGMDLDIFNLFILADFAVLFVCVLIESIAALVWVADSQN